MQHKHVVKKLNIDVWTILEGGGGRVGGSVAKTFATMLLHS